MLVMQTTRSRYAGGRLLAGLLIGLILFPGVPASAREAFASVPAKLEPGNSDRTKKNRKKKVGEDQQKFGAAMGARYEAAYGGQLDHGGIRMYVREIGDALTGAAGLDHQEWHFVVLDSDLVNHFGLPGNRVYVTRGLLELLTNEAQIASALAIEIAHLERKDLWE